MAAGTGPQQVYAGRDVGIFDARSEPHVEQYLDVAHEFTHPLGALGENLIVMMGVRASRPRPPSLCAPPPRHLRGGRAGARHDLPDEHVVSDTRRVEIALCIGWRGLEASTKQKEVA